ncbi:MAG TPA: hypothetical protein HA294_06195 [Nanoarchaeota archaeon]|nr:hypothetical protein [Nanoarchaeota archaeon]HIJ05306.1 hypothetical protein [Nanoarchaeota archaeon]
MKKYSFIQSSFVSLLLFFLLFSLGFFVKDYIGDFFSSVDRYQAEIQSLESGLANQSTEALLALDPLVGDFQSSVVKAFLLFIILSPFLVYLLLSLCESFLIGEKWRGWDYYGYSFLIGLPLLLFFYLTMNSLFESFANSFMSWKALLLFLLYLFVYSFLSYAWYVCVSLFAYSSLKKWKVIYTNFFPLYFLFIPFFVMYLFLFGYLVYFLVSVMVGSFFGNDFWIFFAFFVFFVFLLTLFRLLFVYFLHKYLY